MQIRKITDRQEQTRITREILEALPEWFGIPEAREAYIRDSAGAPYVCAQQDNGPVGFLYLKQTGKDTMEIAAMGVRKEAQRAGIGTALLELAKAMAREQGCSFLQVKTVQMGKYEVYDRTNRFYQSVGFREFEVFPTLWDEGNPCQIYVMAL
ncbi:GNAT family N-acetyltransferase [Candidatus Avoscillospira sp. LCP25S3_F1]|uniref:GNAT family N-acetyltransferase n=1 Tax=Candidatus Avoscillospira sp. LCP25S3_F1 TaxID=3438825 RepID=UPI003F900500